MWFIEGILFRNSRWLIMFHCRHECLWAEERGLWTRRGCQLESCTVRSNESVDEQCNEKLPHEIKFSLKEIVVLPLVSLRLMLRVDKDPNGPGTSGLGGQRSLTEPCLMGWGFIVARCPPPTLNTLQYYVAFDVFWINKFMHLLGCNVFLLTALKWTKNYQSYGHSLHTQSRGLEGQGQHKVCYAYRKFNMSYEWLDEFIWLSIISVKSWIRTDLDEWIARLSEYSEIIHEQGNVFNMTVLRRETSGKGYFW